MRTFVALLVLAAFALPTASYAQAKLFRWVDDKGVVHYGDRIPPEFANLDRNVLNTQGVTIGFEEGEVTEAERAELARLEAEAENDRLLKAEVARRDRMLLQTYLSVTDIEDLRDRRLELLESQIKVTELYLNNLRKRLTLLQEEASAFKPYTARAEAPQVPENLARDISQTAASINLYEKTLSRTRIDQQSLRASFNDDIERFRELKGG
jgi:hypothetical protein